MGQNTSSSKKKRKGLLGLKVSKSAVRHLLLRAVWKPIGGGSLELPKCVSLLPLISKSV